MHRYVASYQIDEQNRICAVGDDWQAVAEMHGASNRCGFTHLCGHSVFDQFADAETRMIYAMIFERVRTSQQPVRFNIHCDALDMVRHLAATIVPLADNYLEVSFRILDEQPRNPALVLQIAGDDQPFITMCSYCGNLKNRQGEWLPLEDEISSEDLFASARLPKISHGICPACAKDFLASVIK